MFGYRVMFGGGGMFTLHLKRVRFRVQSLDHFSTHALFESFQSFLSPPPNRQKDIHYTHMRKIKSLHYLISCSDHMLKQFFLSSQANQPPTLLNGIGEKVLQPSMQMGFLSYVLMFPQVLVVCPKEMMKMMSQVCGNKQSSVYLGRFCHISQ